ncbi:MAG: hypothetical protein FWD13_07345 [Treponema sp.]|nr:hypothetical protein [Treponema sp.]
MTKIFSYVLKIDDGAAPNPFGGLCTLTICKPIIRRKAKIGDWVIGTGSKNAMFSNGKKHDLSNYLVYAMKVTEKMYFKKYDIWCKENLQIKIPKFDSTNIIEQRGDCIYDFSNFPPILRKSVHTEENRKTDVSGKFSLHSNHFYYFGENPILLPEELKIFIKGSQGHLVFSDVNVINYFERWISQYPLNICNEPQLKELLTKENCYRCLYFNELKK